MASRSAMPMAVILGGDVNGLGVARSLGRAGVRVLLLDTDLARPTMRTRHGDKARVPALAGDAFIESLVALRARFDRKPVLIPTQEASVTSLSAHRARLASLYAFALPDDALVLALQDKTGFQALAERLGFAVPKSRVLTKGAD